MEHAHVDQSPPVMTAGARTIFIVLFSAVYLVALAPPIYIALSNQHMKIAAVPASVWYMLLVSAAPIAVTYGLWVVERRQGDED